MFGTLAIGLAIGMPFTGNQNLVGTPPPGQGPYLLADGTDILLADGTPMLLA